MDTYENEEEQLNAVQRMTSDIEEAESYRRDASMMAGEYMFSQAADMMEHAASLYDRVGMYEDRDHCDRCAQRYRDTVSGI